LKKKTKAVKLTLLILLFLIENLMLCQLIELSLTLFKASIDAGICQLIELSLTLFKASIDAGICQLIKLSLTLFKASIDAGI